MNDEQVAALAEAISQRTDRGWKQVGWKLGFGSETGKQALGIDEPLVAALFDAGARQPGARVEFGALSKPMVEPEIAAWMGIDTAVDASHDDLRAAVSSLVPAIEVADVAFAPQDPVEVLRGNIYQWSWIAAADDGSGWGAGGEQTIQVTFADEHWSQDEPESMTGSLLEGLAQCNAVAHRLGRGLRAGDVVFLGSVIPPQPIVAGDFRVTFADGRGVNAVFG